MSTAESKVRGALEEAWDRQHGPHITQERAFTFVRLLDIGTDEAFLAAAMMLVPEGMHWLRKSTGAMTVFTPPASDKEWAVHHDGCGRTPAEALLSAIAAARSADRG